MVQHTIKDVTVKLWNGDFHRVVEILESLIVVPCGVKTTIHVYEPLVGDPSLFYKEFSLTSTNDIFVLFTGEGHSYKEYDILLKHLEDLGLPKSKVLLYTAASEIGHTEYNHIQNISGIVDNTLTYSGEQLQPIHRLTSKFVFLNRMHRWNRQALYEQIIDRNLINEGTVSYLEVPPGCEDSVHYPRVLDSSSVSLIEGYDIAPMVSSFINVISETSYERTDKYNDGIDFPGLTEKTFKSILLSQLPLFLSSYKTVYHYRLLGFDAFDDIIDHSYDLIEDPNERIVAVATELERLVRMRNLRDMKRLRKSLVPRFNKNLKVLRGLRSLNREKYFWWIFLHDQGIV
jgi:hypothetical protein